MLDSIKKWQCKICNKKLFAFEMGVHFVKHHIDYWKMVIRKLR